MSEESRNDEYDAEAANGVEHSSEGRSLPEGDTSRGQGESQGVRDPQEQVIWPTFEQIAGILYELAAELFGTADNPFPAFRVRDRALLESAIALPHQRYYETFEDKLAAMVRSIAANHALEDGNKRLSVAVLHATLLVNGRVYGWGDEEAALLAERCATGDTDFRWLANFIRVWSAPAPTPISLAPQALLETISAQRTSRLGTVPAASSATDVIRAHARGDLALEQIDQLLDARGPL